VRSTIDLEEHDKRMNRSIMHLCLATAIVLNQLDTAVSEAHNNRHLVRNCFFWKYIIDQ